MILAPSIAVVPVLIGPLSALMALLPAILVALGGIIVTLFRPSTVKRIARLLWAQKGMVIVIALVIWGGTHLLSAAFPSGRASGVEGSGEAAWPLWRGGVGRTAAVTGTAEPSEGNVVWSYIERDVKTFYASPAVVGNRVYITSARYEYFRDTGAICAVDADTGQEAWSYSDDKYLASFSSPAVMGKYLVVGEGLHLTRDARIVCMDIEQSEKQGKGVKLWEYRTGSHVESSPCIYEDRLCIGAGDDGFYCLALEPDEKGNAQVLWHLDGKAYPDCETSPVAQDGKVYFGLGNKGQAICCVDIMTGELLWRVDAPYPVFGSPALADNRLFVGMGHGDFVNPAEQVAANLRLKLEKEGLPEAEIEEAASAIKPVGEVWCLDAESGEKLWAFTCERTVLGAVAVADKRVYANSRDKHVYCLSLDGKLIRKWNAGEPVTSSPCVGKDYLYVVTASARLYALALGTLTPVWEVSLDSETLSSPALARGHIYIGTANKGLLCVGQPASESGQQLWAGHLGGNGASGSLDGSLIPERGTLARWSFPEELPEGGLPQGLLPIQAPIAHLGESIYVGANNTNGSGLVKLTQAEGIHNKPVEAWFAPSANPVSISAALTETEVFFVDGEKDDADRFLRCLDPVSGNERWRYAVGADGNGRFVVARDRLFINDTAEGVTCVETCSGAVVWRAEVGTCIGAPSMESGFAIVAVASPPRLAALDAGTGALIWEEALESTPTTGPLGCANRVWVGLPSGIVGCALIHGEDDIRIAAGDAAGTLVSDGTRVACVTLTGQLLVVDARQGTEIARIEGVAGQFPPLLTDGACLFNAEGSIQLYDFQSGTAQQWTRLSASWPGAMVTPMVMVESHVFFATDKKGLICMKPRQH